MLLAGMLAVLVGSTGSPQAAQAGAVCEQAVVRDWKRDGRVDGVYPLSCYRRALAQLPADVRDYSDAPTEIERALAIASNDPARPSQAQADVGSSHDAPPFVLVALGGLVLLVAALGATALLRATRPRRRPAS